MYVDDLGAIGRHDERRLLDHIVPDAHDHIGVLHRTVRDTHAWHAGRSHILLGALIDHALAHHGGDGEDARVIDKPAQRIGKCVS